MAAISQAVSGQGYCPFWLLSARPSEIAYNSNSSIHVYKHPVPAHKLWFCIPNDASVIMGHTRMTTQGSEEKNYNPPFLGCAGDLRFTLAHNGILHNDRMLRRSLKLPHTKIETDSYATVQLIERSGLYLYASTEEILGKTLTKMRLCLEKPQRVEVKCGEILKIDKGGTVTRSTFDIDSFLRD